MLNSVQQLNKEGSIWAEMGCAPGCLLNEVALVNYRNFILLNGICKLRATAELLQKIEAQPSTISESSIFTFLSSIKHSIPPSNIRGQLVKHMFKNYLLDDLTSHHDARGVHLYCTL